MTTDARMLGLGLSTLTVLGCSGLLPPPEVATIVVYALDEQRVLARTVRADAVRVQRWGARGGLQGVVYPSEIDPLSIRIASPEEVQYASAPALSAYREAGGVWTLVEEASRNRLSTAYDVAVQRLADRASSRWGVVVSSREDRTIEVGLPAGEEEAWDLDVQQFGIHQVDEEAQALLEDRERTDGMTGALNWMQETGRLPPGRAIVRDEADAYIVYATPVIDALDLTDVSLTGDLHVAVSLDADGGDALCALTSAATGMRLAIVQDERATWVPKVFSPLCGDVFHISLGSDPGLSSEHERLVSSVKDAAIPPLLVREERSAARGAPPSR